MGLSDGIWRRRRSYLGWLGSILVWSSWEERELVGVTLTVSSDNGCVLALCWRSLLYRRNLLLVRIVNGIWMLRNVCKSVECSDAVLMMGTEQLSRFRIISSYYPVFTEAGATMELHYPSLFPSSEPQRLYTCPQRGHTGSVAALIWDLFLFACCHSQSSCHVL